MYKRITDHTAGALAARLSAERDNGYVPPDFLSPSLVNLIDRLLVPDPALRLGSALDAAEGSPSGFAALRAHAWFGAVKWDKLAEGVAPSPLRGAAEAHVTQLFLDHDARPSDAVLDEYVESTEYLGDGSWFANY